MKILYSVQATGNGHISRAMELLPYLKKYGEVDVFLSGANSSLNLDAPIKYRSKGMSLFYTCTGELDYAGLLKNFAPLVEIGSGLGYWAKLLQSEGVDVLPYDCEVDSDKSWTLVQGSIP